MASKRARTTLIVAATAAVLSLTSCACVGERVELVDMRTEQHSVELDGAERVVVDLDMGVGKLVVLSGSESLMDAEFTYNVEEWKPAIEYSIVGGKGRLTVDQPDAQGNYTLDRNTRFLASVSKRRGRDHKVVVATSELNAKVAVSDGS